MPGWYIHMQAAQLTAQRLQVGDVPPELELDPHTAQEYGSICHRWRNFLAVGSIGPDMFYLLPDFHAPFGNFVFNLVKTVSDLWENIDELFIAPWEEYMGPVGANDADLKNALTLGLNNQIAQAMDEVNGVVSNVWETILTRMVDVFGILTSGVPRGLGETAFYWSDMFHYRDTYAFPQELFKLANEDLESAKEYQQKLEAAGPLSDDDNARVRDRLAKAESNLAFAIGWLTHCGTDVTGHPFTNAKCGGPFRLHWGRHHLVENHFDAAAYDATHHGDKWFEALDTSALHFRIAFRNRKDAPYYGCNFAPAYDYFTGFPQYPLGDAAIDTVKREMFFDMDAFELPEHLRKRLIKTMTNVYYPAGGEHGPRVLEDVPNFNDGGSGRPNDDALKEMWDIIFFYLRMISRGGLHPRRPQPPPIATLTPFPTPPGGSLPSEDDDRGADPEDDDDADGHPWNFFAFIIGLFAWIVYIFQIIVWLVTVLPGIIGSILTFPAREFLYAVVVAPLYELYLVSRKMLVMTGFLPPKPEEIDEGLVTLGYSSEFGRLVLKADLDDPVGYASARPAMNEPSGRVDTTQEWGADPAFPRQTVTDPVPLVDVLARKLNVTLPPFLQRFNSEWLAPWRYPDTDLAGQRVGWEPHLSHPGPWQQGVRADRLLAMDLTDMTAANKFETAETPDATEAACAALFPHGQHLGNPVDYSLYLVARTANGVYVPDFNLDSDRGYGWRCWDWQRHKPLDPSITPNSENDFHVYEPFSHTPFPVPRTDKFDFEQPCTVPEQFDPALAANQDANRKPLNSYRPTVPLATRYLDMPDVQCSNDVNAAVDMTEEEKQKMAEKMAEEIARAGFSPAGEDG
jgi:hypothetical protein